MNKKWLLFVILVLVVGLMAGSALAQDEEEPIIIGAVFNSTGWMAAYDQPPRQGATIAVAEINEAGGILGRPVELLILDGETDPATVGNAALQLVEAGADFIITPSDFDIGGPASAVAQEAGLVGMSPGASSPLFGSIALGDMQFTLAPWTNYGSAAAAEWGFEQGWETAYVITDTSIDYSDSQGFYFTQAWEMIGGTIVGEDTFIQGDQDFSGQLQRLQSLDEQPDVIFIASYMPDVATIIRDIRALGIETPILGGDALDTSEFYDVLGTEFGNDIYYATMSWMGEENGERMVDFIAAYDAEFGEPPDNSFIALGYDAVYVFAEAAESAGTLEGPAVAEQMRELVFEGLLTGTMDWGDVEAGHETTKESWIVGLDEGVPFFITAMIAETVPEPR